MNSGKKSERVIFHVDMDSFYASCELAINPSFRDKPFIVGADPKEGKGRGVVLACNYPAREFGVRSGMPISLAWELCPTARYVPPNHNLYGEVSRRVMSVLKEFTSKIEQISIDEAYLDFTDDASIAPLIPSQRNQAISSIASAIKRKVHESEHITCSIGVSSSKIVSKIATDMRKPNGLTIVDLGKEVEFLGPLPVEKIPGVGKVTQKILLESFSVRTISDLSRVTLESLREKFGRTAIWFHEVAAGIDETDVVTNWEPSSQSSETTFEEDETDYEVVSKVMKDVAIDVHRRTVNEGFLFRNVGIKIRFAGFETHARSRTLSSPTDSLEAVLRECERLLSEFAASRKKVRLIGVRLASLEQRQTKGQRTLPEWTD